MSVYELVVGVLIWAKVVQVLPVQRSTLYPVTPTLSVEAVHERLIWDEEMTDAVRLVGVEGGVVSEGGGVLKQPMGCVETFRSS